MSHSENILCVPVIHKISKLLGLVFQTLAFFILLPLVGHQIKDLLHVY